eukprot:SAG31_NODE_371_length_16628_cov_3.741943_8_plen_128_part_00
MLIYRPSYLSLPWLLVHRSVMAPSRTVSRLPDRPDDELLHAVDVLVETMSRERCSRLGGGADGVATAPAEKQGPSDGQLSCTAAQCGKVLSAMAGFFIVCTTLFDIAHYSDGALQTVSSAKWILLVR